MPRPAVLDADRVPLVAVVLTKNEELAIGDCVASLIGHVDEVVVVDSGSGDRTAEIARARGARVVSFSWDHRYPKKKQWAMEHVDTPADWMLFLDADERLTPDLAAAVAQLRASGFSGCSAYDVPVVYTWGGRRLRFGQRVSKRILVDRTRCAYVPVDDLDAPGSWEVEGHYQPRVDGRVGTVEAALLHDDPDPVSDWFGRHNRYSDWEAYLRTHDAARRATRSMRSVQGKVLDALPFKPAAVFLNSYVLRLGVLDGRAGRDYALALAFYQWQVSVKVRERRAHR